MGMSKNIITQEEFSGMDQQVIENTLLGIDPEDMDE